MSPRQRPLRLLSLDGGGIRGLSSIVILKDIMKQLSDRCGRQLQPWEVFDMIGGTSTGGLIAVMLGRLRMTLDQCQAAYLKLSRKIFNPKRHTVNIFGRSKDFLQANGRLNTKALEDAIKEIITDNGLPVDALLKDPDASCKVYSHAASWTYGHGIIRINANRTRFVCAIHTSTSDTALLRSYENPKMPGLLYDESRIWEACRATSAAPTFFDPITIGSWDQRFADGAVGYNNPINVVYREAGTIWPERIDDATLVSIGTGSAPGIAFEGNIRQIIDALSKIVTQTEIVANDFFLDHRQMLLEDRLYRFNVQHGLADVGLEEYQERGKIATTTQSYLMSAVTRVNVDKCVSSLVRTDREERAETRPVKGPEATNAPEDMEHSPMVGTVSMQQSVEPGSQTLSPPVQEPSSSVAQFSISSNPLTAETVSIDSVTNSSVSPDLPPLHKDFDASFSLFEKIVDAYCDKSNLALLYDRYDGCCLPTTYDPEKFSESYGYSGEYWLPLSEENARKALLDLNPGAGYTFMSPEARIKGRSLCLAIVMKDLDLVKSLLDDGAIVGFRDQIDVLNDGNETFRATPLVLAAVTDSLPILKLLLGAGAEVNQTDPLRGRTVLHSAAFFANENIIRALLEGGADREIRDIKGWKALHCATYGVRPGRAGFQVANLRAMELLIEGEADLESCTRDGLTPLHISVYTYQQDATIWLLKQGASVHAKTGDGKTALDFLYVRSHKAKTGIDENPIALALLYYGGFSRGKFGGTRLHGAVQLQKQAYVALLLSPEAETLFQPPPSQHVNTRNDFGRTPLHYAALNANQAIIECLLNNGANTEIKDRKGNTAIHYAAAYPERVGCFQELVLAGADVKSKGALGVTALHLAAQWEIDEVAVPLEDINMWGPDEMMFNVLEVLGFLLKAGAVVDARTDSGATALSLAAAADNDERMELLLNASAPPSRRRAVLADALLFAKRQKRLNKARLVEDFGPELGFARELVSSWMMNRIVCLVMPAAFILCLVIWWLMA